MATQITDSGIQLLTPNASIINSNNSEAILAEMRAKVIKAQDLDDVVNYYRQWFGVSWASRPIGTRITASDFNALRAAIIAGMSNAWTASIPAAAAPGSLIRGSFWGKPKTLFQGATYEFTSPGNYSVLIPSGARTLKIDQMIAGGGGGAGATESGNGGSGSAGGTGGYRANEYYTVADNQTITVVIGAGGAGASGAGPGSAGGASCIYIAGNQIALCTGGGGGDYWVWSGGNGGPAGSPNGIAGSRGNVGWDDSSSGNGVDGPNSPLGTGGRANGKGWPWPSDATGYGAGGASGGWADRSWPWNWPGSAGSGGYCKLEILPP